MHPELQHACASLLELRVTPLTYQVCQSGEGLATRRNSSTRSDWWPARHG